MRGGTVERVVRLLLLLLEQLAFALLEQHIQTEPQTLVVERRGHRINVAPMIRIVAEVLPHSGEEPAIVKTANVQIGFNGDTQVTQPVGAR
nr:MAG: hypothetical protein [Apis mellifera filamentous virus]